MKILIAEDDRLTRMVVEKSLARWGYETVAVASGEEAWSLLSTPSPSPPSLALLDWEMPKVSGVEICQRLRDRGEEPFVYTILLTRRNEAQDILDAYSFGAHDYLCKPVEPEILRCRIEVGRRLVEMHERLRTFAKEMERLAENRARQLVHADRLVSLGTLSAGVAHEINNPTSCVLGNAGLLRSLWPAVEEAIQSYLQNGRVSSDHRDALALLLEKGQSVLESIERNAERIGGIVDKLRRFYRREDPKVVECSLVEAIHNALEICQSRLRDLHVQLEIAPDTPKIHANPLQIEQVLVNLLINAADAMEGHDEKSLTIRTESLSDRVRITVADTGPGIPPNQLEAIWDAFFTTKSEGKGTGLGLSITKSIIEAHGGEIQARNRPEGGAEFIMTLPPSPPRSQKE